MSSENHFGAGEASRANRTSLARYYYELVLKLAEGATMTNHLYRFASLAVCVMAVSLFPHSCHRCFFVLAKIDSQSGVITSVGGRVQCEFGLRNQSRARWRRVQRFNERGDLSLCPRNKSD